MSMTWLKGLFFHVIVPGTVAFFLPWHLFDLSADGISRGTPMTRLVAIVLMAGGVALLLRATWGFVVEGKGTPSPTPPPTALVLRGPYRFTRNPMYVGVLSVLAAESLLFSVPALFMYAVLVGVRIFHLFVVL